jgi:hypothetical protein
MGLVARAHRIWGERDRLWGSAIDAGVAYTILDHAAPAH